MALVKKSVAQKKLKTSQVKLVKNRSNSKKLSQPTDLKSTTTKKVTQNKAIERVVDLDLVATTKYWLMKSEPESFSIDDLKKKGRSSWDGVRNYQSRNFMRDHMKVGHYILFYHSNATPAGIAGIAKVSRESHADHTALDPRSPYFDPKASPENPIWMMVEVEFIKKFKNLIPLEELKKHQALEDLLVIRRGMRLSVQPIQEKHFEYILAMSGLTLENC